MTSSEAAEDTFKNDRAFFEEKDQSFRTIDKGNGLYYVKVNGGIRYPLYITRDVARHIAAVLKNPAVMAFDLVFVKQIDADAKPILEQAINDFRGVGLEIGSYGYEHGNSDAVDPWVEQAVLASENPNLSWVNQNSEPLKRRSAENNAKADALTERMVAAYQPTKKKASASGPAVQVQKPTPLTGEECQQIAQRLPLILFNREYDIKHRMRPDDQAAAIKKWESVLWRTRVAATAFGIALNEQMPTALQNKLTVLQNDLSQQAAESDRFAKRYLRTVPSEERSGPKRGKTTFLPEVLAQEGNRETGHAFERYLAERSQIADDVLASRKKGSYPTR